MTTPPIRVLIVDSHEGVRRALSTALATVDDILVVGQASSGMEALQRCSQVRPDVVLMEIEFPDRDGIGIVELIRQDHRRVQIVVLTAAYTPGIRQRAEAAGAYGYLPKYVAVDEVVQVIRAAAQEEGKSDGHAQEYERSCIR